MQLQEEQQRYKYTVEHVLWQGHLIICVVKRGVGTQVRTVLWIKI